LEESFAPEKFIASGGNGYADGMYTLFPYQEYAVKKLLFDWKQEEFPDLPVIFTPFMQKFVNKDLLPHNIHYISYLPRRKHERFKMGFDQAERMATIYSQLLGLPLEALLIRKGLFRKAQHKARYEKREKNVRGAFRATRPLEGETVLLVDDIVTTGATAREGARILKKAGAMKVYILSMAH
jgi:predicted amidophosphoribosyltransferase